MARPGVLMPKWWSTLAALGGCLCAAGVITRWGPLLLVALTVQGVVLVTYARRQWWRAP